MKNVKKSFAFILITFAFIITFVNGKRQGQLECKDFNVLAILANIFNIAICFTLITIALFLITQKSNKHLKN